MRLLFFGDLAATGFGSVTLDLGKALLDRGVDVRFISQNEIGALPEPYASRTTTLATFINLPPDMSNPHGGIDPTQMPAFIAQALAGNNPLIPLANGDTWGDWKPEAVFLLGDFYGIRLMWARFGPAFASLPTFHYVPIEGHDLPPAWNDIWSTVQPLAMSHFGAREIEKVTGSQPPLMYHGVDTDEFRPVSTTDPIRINETVVLTSKERCKAFFRIHPAMRVLLRCDANMPRKGYPQLVRSLAPVLAERPNVALCLKTSLEGQGGHLGDVLSKLPENVRSRILIMDMKLPRVALRALYNAADVYVSNSAEGFGLTIAEAIACGVPAVGLDYSAVPEVIGPAGTVVPVGLTWDNEYAHYWALPDEAAFGKAVAYMLDHPARARELGAHGPAHVRRTFDWGESADVLIGVLNERLGSHTRAMVAA